MNIAILTPSFFPIRGGTEQLVYEVAKRNKKHGNSIIITPKIKGSKSKEIVDGIKVYRFPYVRFPLLNALSAQFVLFFWLPKILRKERIDLLHMYHVYMLGGVAVLASRKNKIPLISHPIGWDTYDPIRSVPKIFWPYMAWVMNSSTKVLTSCQSMKKHAQKQGCRQNIEIIPHGSNMNSRKASKLDIRKKYKIPKSNKIIFSLQRLAPRKGLHYLIKAGALVTKKRKNVTFIIGGKGPEKEKLQALAKKLKLDVIFAGFIPDEDLKNYYQQADLFALPSLYEGFGIVYVDALLNGLPIVATACGGPEDIVTHDNGLLVPTRNSQALADALTTALQKKWNRKKIKTDAKKYDWENVYKLYRKIYEEIKK